MVTSVRSPLEIIVAWDMESEIGPELGRSLFAWLTGNPDNPVELGLDIPVSFRTPRADGEIRDIPWDESAFHVVLLLVDDAMVANRERWENWIDSVCGSVAEDPDHRAVLSVALTRNFNNLSPALSEYQAIRLVDSAANSGALELEFRARVANEVCPFSLCWERPGSTL